jgi:hypothetical protein
MAERLVKESQNQDSGFFLHAGKELKDVLERREEAGKPSFLLESLLHCLILLKHTLSLFVIPL